MGKDLGTYHVKVEFTDGQGFICKWETGLRYTNGTHQCHPLDASQIKPDWDTEEDLFNTIIYMLTAGNYSCDCNRMDFLADAKQEPRNHDVECGHTLILKRLTVITPDGTEVTLFEEKS